MESQEAPEARIAPDSTSNSNHDAFRASDNDDAPPRASTPERNQYIKFTTILSLQPGFQLEEPKATFDTSPSKIHVILDEAFDPFTAVCAVVLTEEEFQTANEKVENLRADLSSSGYLSTLPSFESFLAKGFHAAEDTTEVKARFIDDAYKSLPGKAFIYYTNGERRIDLSAKKTVLLLYACVIQVVFMHHKSAKEVVFHFERHQTLDRYYHQVTELARRRSRTRSRARTEICKKGYPPSLALADYILHIFGQSIEFIAYGHRPTEKFQYRNLRAIKHHVSLIYSMEFGRIARRSIPW